MEKLGSTFIRHHQELEKNREIKESAQYIYDWALKNGNNTIASEANHILCQVK